MLSHAVSRVFFTFALAGILASGAEAADFTLAYNRITRDDYGTKVRLWQGGYKMGYGERLDFLLSVWL